MVSKLEVGRPDGKLKFPPNNCIPEKYQFYNKGIVGYNGRMRWKIIVPRSANMKMKRKSSSRSDKMDDMALVKATTRLRREDQYLKY